MIQHSVIVKLNYFPDSAEETDFLKAASKLAKIPGVKKFQIFRQTSSKNSFDFGIVMEFKNRDVYQQYSDHPDHLKFIDHDWAKGVLDFLEIDYEPLPSR